MNESGLKRRFVAALAHAGLDPLCVENSVHPGTPDVNYVDGWVELKYMPGWPVNDGVLRVQHFTPQQRVWLRRRWELGGRAFLLLQVGSDLLLFDGKTAAEWVGRGTRAVLEGEALEHTRIIEDICAILVSHNPKNSSSNDDAGS